MENLINKQDSLYDQIHRLGVNLKKSPKIRLTQGHLQTRLESLETYWGKFMSTHDELINVVPIDKQAAINYFHENKYNKCEDEYFDVKSVLKDLLFEVPDLKLQSTSQVSNEQRSETHIQTKLPPIHMPKFNGSYNDWLAFNDLYCSLIHNNESLSDVQKFHYLKSCLVGEAEQMLRHYSLTHANYKKAWEHLKSRYHNKRCIVNAQLTKLLTQRKIHSESARSIKDLLDTTSECLHALDNLEVSTSSWDAIIVYLTVSKLDSESHKLWEQLLGSSTELPSFERLREFLETRFRTLEVLHPSREVTKPNTKSFSTNIATTTTTTKCAFCSESHYICHCKEFAKLDIHKRREYVHQKGLCFNCLIPGHSVHMCKQTTTCRKCGRKHHSLLHVNYPTSKTQTITTTCTEELLPPTTQDTLQLPTARTALKAEIKGCKVLLVTALVLVKSRNGTTHTLRALVDQGSQASFITESAAQLLGLRRTPIQGHVTGINSTKTMQTRSMIESLVLTSLHEEFNISINAYVLTTLTTILPAHKLICLWPQISKFKLADPTYSTPGRIDLLLGAEVYSQILLDGLHKSDQGILAQNSHLGWLLSGKINEPNPSCNNIVIMHSRLEVDQMLRTFWELEEIQTNKRLQTKAEIKCEEFYANTTKRTSEGRYIIRLPFAHEDPSSSFGETRNRAINRLYQMERRFKRQPELKIAYTEFLQNYLNLGHMTLIPKYDHSNPNAYYLPHHAVFKESSTTTKVRVVFDGSAKSSNGVSLNDLLLVGPTLQQDIRDIILRWRRHKICFVADIKMMYRQILVDNSDTNYQRIVWRLNDTDVINEYKLRTVTYGTSSAPYLAIRTLQQLAEDEQLYYPTASAIIRNDFYVDDLMSGGSTKEEAVEISKQLTRVLEKGGFELRKWASNSRTFLETIPSDYREHAESLKIEIGDTIKALGISWNPSTDTFELKPSLRATNHYPLTKRTVLSDIASMFDPLGWLAPTIVLAKIMLQKLWLAGLDWDEKLPSHLAEEWLKYRTDLVQMDTIQLRRWIGIENTHNQVELHGFSDASCMAYSAVVYSRVIKADGSIQVTLVAAKTKVAPVKQVSLPRLELCGAVLLAKLLSQIKLSLNIPDKFVFAWTDSTIVLAWLQSCPNRWKTFVANRVTEIVNILNNNQWNHVKSQDNPADCASRGVSPLLLQSHPLWWTGPVWLRTQDIPLGKLEVSETNLECKVSILCNSMNNINDYFEKFSSLRKLLRVTAFCIRFINNCRIKINMRGENNYVDDRSLLCVSLKSLTVNEIKNAMFACLRLAQNLHFPEEISQLSRKLDLKNKSALLSLNPILDPNGIMRVGGRLRHANISDSMRHPIILSYASHLSKLIVADAHVKTLHGGPQLMLNFIRSKYWILGVKNLVKKHVHTCIICFKRSAKSTSQLMGDLPKSRVNPAKPFSSCGVDFAGPFLIRFSKGRGTKSSKGYISLFICTVTKAIHLEVVSDLSSQGFIAAFKRFVARRGHCHDIWSDCGTNFVGASKELDLMFKNTTSQLTKEIADLLVNDGTTWHFIPPGSPHFGGLWEAGVKSVKYHLNRILGDTKLTYEEFSTVLTQIEACLNSRPLTSLSNHPQDLNPLTPGHFLVGEPLMTIPEENFLDVPHTRLSRWHLTQKITQDFWDRWRHEYLPTLQPRTKWKTKKHEISVGDLVFVKDERLPPGKWLLGRVKAKHPGPDGITRVVTLQCKNSTIKRPLVKLCPLPLDDFVGKDKM